MVNKLFWGGTAYLTNVEIYQRGTVNYLMGGFRCVMSSKTQKMYYRPFVKTLAEFRLGYSGDLSKKTTGCLPIAPLALSPKY